MITYIKDFNLQSGIDNNSIPPPVLIYVATLFTWVEVVPIALLAGLKARSERSLRSASFRSICFVLEFNGRCASSYS
jgi:hypothetical protein